MRSGLQEPLSNAANREQILMAAQQGGREAFDSLMRLYDAPLRCFLARRVGSNAADDILQETWLACWLALPRYSRRSSFRDWLYGIACHKCADYSRAQRRTSVETPLNPSHNAVQDELDRYAVIELKQTVHAILAYLPEGQREVLELYYYGEQTLPEVAQTLGRNLNTVKSQFYRGHTQVASHLRITTVSTAELCYHGKE